MWPKLGLALRKSGQYSELIESVEWLDKNQTNEILKQKFKEELEEDTELNYNSRTDKKWH